MLLRQIDERWPGVNLRIACNRHLAATPTDLQVLAAELRLTPRDLRGWLQGDQSIYILGLSSESLKTLEKYKNSKKKNKSGRKRQEIDWYNVRRIKDYGVEEYCDSILRERQRRCRALRESAVARADTHS